LVLSLTACTGTRRHDRSNDPPAPQPVRLSLKGYTFPYELGGATAPSGRRFLQVELTLENSGSETAIAAGASAFRLTTIAGVSHTADRTASTMTLRYRTPMRS